MTIARAWHLVLAVNTAARLADLDYHFQALKSLMLRAAPFRFVIRQGYAMGRPSVLRVDVPEQGGITVTGTAIDR